MEGRVVVAVVGMLLAFAGVVLQHRPIVWASIGVLGVAFAMRFLGTRADRALREGKGDSTRS